jgi:hypothetical protein
MAGVIGSPECAPSSDKTSCYGGFESVSMESSLSSGRKTALIPKKGCFLSLCSQTRPLHLVFMDRACDQSEGREKIDKNISAYLF